MINTTNSSGTINSTNYKFVCINLKRRPDRRNRMETLFNTEKITNYEFFDAIDGQDLGKDNGQNLHLLKKSRKLQKGVAGCALSHYCVWKNLVNDQHNNIYVVLEDDIEFGTNFKLNIDIILSRLTQFTSLVFLGITVPKNMYDSTRSKYLHKMSYTIHALDFGVYYGGAFGYIITKDAASKLINRIDDVGFYRAIDYIMVGSGFDVHETHPHLVYTNAVGECNHHVDSDIQYDMKRVIFEKIPNNYVFDNYVFYPGKDSYGGDIREVYADIPTLKKMADNLEHCVGFNTYGYLKNHIVPTGNFIDIGNEYYDIDGLYVKKSFVFGK